MDSETMFDFDDELIDKHELRNEKIKSKQVNLDMWGPKTSKYHKKCFKINKYMKPFRLAILKYILEVMEQVNVNIMIYAGSALSIWRDNGKVIPHDHDMDLAILESDFLRAYKGLNERKEIVAETRCPFTGRTWFNEDETEQILYDKVGVKRMKIYFRESYIKEMGETDPKFVKLWDRYKRNTLTLDIFSLQKKPGTNCYRVTWHIEGRYDYDNKCFPEDIFYPLKDYTFEGIPVFGPRDIKRYLVMEYEYLEKDARFDDETQVYVKLTEREFKLLPACIKYYMRS